MTRVLLFVSVIVFSLTFLGGCTSEGQPDTATIRAETAALLEANEQAQREILALRAAGNVQPGSKEDKLLTAADTGLKKVGTIAGAVGTALNEDGTVNPSGIAAALTAIAPGPIGTGLGLAFIIGSGIYNVIQRKRLVATLAEAKESNKALTETVLGVKDFMDKNSTDNSVANSLKNSLVKTQDGSTQIRVDEIKRGIN